MSYMGDTEMVTWPDRPDWPDAGRLEEEAYRIVRSRIDLARLPRISRDVTERIIYASADFSYASDLICAEESLTVAVAALAAGAPVIADVPMVAAGISGWPVICKAGEPLTRRLARTTGIAMAAAAVRLAYGDAGPGAVWVVGCEPAAIDEILARGTEPAFVIGLPAGFVGAAEAKKALRCSGIPALTNVSCNGGPAAAVAACLALLRLAQATTAGGPSGWGEGERVAVAPADERSR
jgi:precorrin-8X/cobalt-precorrin-8 methylmutase